MNFINLEIVLNQIKNYNLVEKNENIKLLILKLKERQIKHLSSFTDELPEFIYDKDIILINNHYFHDIVLICKSTSILPYTTQYLEELSCDMNSLSSEHHEKDMELIANAKSDKIADCLCELARNANSLISKYHEKDMELIANAKSDTIACNLCDFACNIYSLESQTHEKDMEAIANAKSDENAREIFFSVEDKCELFPSSVYNKKDKKLIASAKTDTITKCLTSLATYYSYSRYYKKDMELIVKAKSDTIAICLKFMASNIPSLLSGFHEKTMELIANAKTDIIALCIRDLAHNSYEDAIEYLFDKNYEKTIELIVNAKTDTIAKCLGTFINRLSLFSLMENQEKYLELIAHVKSEETANCLLCFLNSSLWYKCSNQFEIIEIILQSEEYIRKYKSYGKSDYNIVKNMIYWYEMDKNDEDTLKL